MADSFKEDPARVSLEHAKQWLRERVDIGAECPCCTQFAKVYRRPMTGSMAYALILIERYFRMPACDEWLHVPSYLSKWSKVGSAVRGGDWAKLVHWRVLEEKPEQLREDGSHRAGYYKITKLGKDFVHARVDVPKYVFIYDGRALPGRQTPDRVFVTDVLGKTFDYTDLMRVAPGSFAEPAIAE